MNIVLNSKSRLSHLKKSSKNIFLFSLVFFFALTPSLAENKLNKAADNLKLASRSNGPSCMISDSCPLNSLSKTNMNNKDNKQKNHKDAPEVKHSIVIKAKPEHVWQAIQYQRKCESNIRKLLSYDGTCATIVENFQTLPIVGAASCTYKESEIPYERIDYDLLKSDQFHVFRGSWVLSSPDNKTDSTHLELSNAIDPGIRVPFWQDITKLAASKMVKRRLEAVSAYAEQLFKQEQSSIKQ